MTSPSGRMTTADLANAEARAKSPENTPRTDVPPQQTIITPTPEPVREAARDQANANEAAAQPHGDEEVSPLFAKDACDVLWRHWDGIQARFVDDPRRSVEDADALVAETMKRLADTFARERANLERQWGQGGEASTEDLRLAFRRYRSFFKRLLAV